MESPIFHLEIIKITPIDAFGDAYEFLMSMYASNAGKTQEENFIHHKK